MSNVRPPRSVAPFDPGGWRGPHAPDGGSLSVVQLIRNGTLDADLAALAWLLVEARVPLMVAAGPQGAGKTTLLTALLDFLPAGVVTHNLQGFDEDFRWLPEAGRLGCHMPVGTRTDAAPKNGQATGEKTGPAITPATGFLVASELSPHLPFYTWGEQARVALRATSLGYGLGATIHADSLQEVFDSLRGPDVRLTDDELSHLGLVLILRAFRGERGEVTRRVVAAHYVRPVSRDAGGHTQRLGPAVLATWERATDSFAHFAWGVTPELALRVGRRAGDFDAEHARRRDVLDALAAAGVEAPHDVRTALDGYRLAATNHRH